MSSNTDDDGHNNECIKDNGFKQPIHQTSQIFVNPDRSVGSDDDGEEINVLESATGSINNSNNNSGIQLDLSKINADELKNIKSKIAGANFKPSPQQMTKQVQIVEIFKDLKKPSGGNLNVPNQIVDASNAGWVVLDPIAKGSFGEVWLGCSLTGNRPVAMKFFKLGAHHVAISELKEEASTLAMLSHNNIVRYVNRAASESYFVIIMEYVRGVSLYSSLRKDGRLSVDDLTRYLPGILRGLGHLHRHGFVHCDIKPDNILIDRATVEDVVEGTVKETVKIADVGSAISLAARNNTAHGAALGGPPMMRGTAQYMAPEAAKGNFVPASDIWSLGVTVFELLTGFLPWSSPLMDDQKMILELSSATPPEPIFPLLPLGLPKDVKDFVKRCLVVDSEQRGTIEELLKFSLFETKFKK